MLKNTWKYLFSNLWDPETLFFTSSSHNKYVVTKKNHKGALAAQLCRFQKSNQTWFSWKRHYGNRIRNQKTTATPHQFPLNTSCKQKNWAEWTLRGALHNTNCTTYSSLCLGKRQRNGLARKIFLPSVLFSSFRSLIL